MGVGFTVGILADETDIATPFHHEPWQTGQRADGSVPAYRYDEPEGIVSARDLAPTDTPSWSYTGFSRFRERLLDAAGLPDQRSLWTAAEVGDPALEPLIWHADDAGILTADECRRVAPRLRELLASDGWEDDFTSYDTEHGARLADLMTFVAEHPSGRLALVFC